jgi:acyl-coenzyme A thioesterase PaaI-like protein
MVMEKRFRGWSNLIHGGILSTMLDECMGWTVISLTGKFMLTKGLQVWFKKPVLIGMKLTVTGFIKERLSEKRVVVVAEVHDESGSLCASSEGEFSLFTREQFLRMNIISEEDMEGMLAALKR